MRPPVQMRMQLSSATPSIQLAPSRTQARLKLFQRFSSLAASAATACSLLCHLKLFCVARVNAVSFSPLHQGVMAIFRTRHGDRCCGNVWLN